MKHLIIVIVLVVGCTARPKPAPDNITEIGQGKPIDMEHDILRGFQIRDVSGGKSDSDSDDQSDDSDIDPVLVPFVRPEQKVSVEEEKMLEKDLNEALRHFDSQNRDSDDDDSEDN